MPRESREDSTSGPGGEGPEIRIGSAEGDSLIEASSEGEPSPAGPGGEAVDSGMLQAGHDRYQLISELGKGGFGIVYLAHDRVLDQDVAIKVLKLGLATDIDRKRFIFEARTGAKLRHPAIVNVFDIMQTEEGLQMVMEYYPGGTMSQRIKREGAIPVKEALQYTRQIATGLAYAHQRQIIHRDVKPANVFFDGEDVVKLGDFGIAATYEVHEHTATGEVMGTPLFMAPEQTLDATDVDPRSDIYSLGLTLYNMVTGKLPRVVDLDLAPRELRKLIRKATEEDRRDRPVSANQFIAMIDRALEKLENLASAPTAPPEPPHKSDPPPIPPAGPTADQAMGSDEETITHAPVPAAPPRASGFGGGMSWSIVALVAVMMAGFVGVVYMLRPDAGDPAAANTRGARGRGDARRGAGNRGAARATPRPEGGSRRAGGGERGGRRGGARRGSREEGSGTVAATVVATPVEATPAAPSPTPAATPRVTPTPAPAPSPAAPPPSIEDGLARLARGETERASRQSVIGFFDWAAAGYSNFMMGSTESALMLSAERNPGDALYSFLLYQLYRRLGDAEKMAERRAEVLSRDAGWFDALEEKLRASLAAKELEITPEQMRTLLEGGDAPSRSRLRTAQPHGKNPDPVEKEDPSKQTEGAGSPSPEAPS